MTVAFHSRAHLFKTEDNEANKGSSKRILNLGFHFCFVSPIRFIRACRAGAMARRNFNGGGSAKRVIRGRLQKLRGSLAAGRSPIKSASYG